MLFQSSEGKLSKKLQEQEDRWEEDDFLEFMTTEEEWV